MKRTFEIMKQNITTISKIGVIVVICVALGVLIGKYTREITISPSHKIKDTLAFKDSVLTYLFELRVQHPSIVYAQFVLETGNFTSKIFLKNNNICGMKMPWSRPTTAVGIRDGHAVYKTWQDSIIDYVIYQSCYLRNLTHDEYLERLNSYAEDEAYLTKVMRIHNTVAAKTL